MCYNLLTDYHISKTDRLSERRKIIVFGNGVFVSATCRFKYIWNDFWAHSWQWYICVCLSTMWIWKFCIESISSQSFNHKSSKSFVSCFPLLWTMYWISIRVLFSFMIILLFVHFWKEKYYQKFKFTLQILVLDIVYVWDDDWTVPQLV